MTLSPNYFNRKDGRDFRDFISFLKLVIRNQSIEPNQMKKPRHKTNLFDIWSFCPFILVDKLNWNCPRIWINKTACKMLNLNIFSTDKHKYTYKFTWIANISLFSFPLLSRFRFASKQLLQTKWWCTGKIKISFWIFIVQCVGWWVQNICKRQLIWQCKQKTYANLAPSRLYMIWSQFPLVYCLFIRFRKYIEPKLVKYPSLLPCTKRLFYFETLILYNGTIHNDKMRDG